MVRRPTPPHPHLPNPCRRLPPSLPSRTRPRRPSPRPPLRCCRHPPDRCAPADLDPRCPRRGDGGPHEATPLSPVPRRHGLPPSHPPHAIAGGGSGDLAPPHSTLTRARRRRIGSHFTTDDRSPSRTDSRTAPAPPHPRDQPASRAPPRTSPHRLPRPHRSCAHPPGAAALDCPSQPSHPRPGAAHCGADAGDQARRRGTPRQEAPTPHVLRGRGFRAQAAAVDTTGPLLRATRCLPPSPSRRPPDLLCLASPEISLAPAISRRRTSSAFCDVPAESYKADAQTATFTKETSVQK
ncbi:hypothetical protein BS78_K123600 [Paspalum vaginatum]|uniref:Uncharacterized protein n=1 Tax=Paspalum vaginatum TaxID=158149 RepID=A0A9W7X8P3_9POAL|nr:hypothetical protein BS78_K123600 [Paspalum vaginatum]